MRTAPSSNSGTGSRRFRRGSLDGISASSDRTVAEPELLGLGRLAGRPCSRVRVYLIRRVGPCTGSGKFGYGIGTPGGVGGLVGGENVTSRVFDVASLNAEAGAAERASAITVASMVRMRIIVERP